MRNEIRHAVSQPEVPTDAAEKMKLGCLSRKEMGREADVSADGGRREAELMPFN